MCQRPVCKCKLSPALILTLTGAIGMLVLWRVLMPYVHDIIAIFAITVVTLLIACGTFLYMHIRNHGFSLAYIGDPRDRIEAAAPTFVRATRVAVEAAPTYALPVAMVRAIEPPRAVPDPLVAQALGESVGAIEPTRVFTPWVPADTWEAAIDQDIIEH